MTVSSDATAERSASSTAASAASEAGSLAVITAVSAAAAAPDPPLSLDRASTVTVRLPLRRRGLPSPALEAGLKNHSDIGMDSGQQFSAVCLINA